jgi:nucleoside-diphosphate-sugar epimerase
MIVDAIVSNIPEAKILYSNNGSDPRNYKVNFNKVKTTLGFEPQYTVQDGIAELIDGLKNGLYSDAVKNKEKYGNYTLMFD